MAIPDRKTILTDAIVAFNRCFSEASTQAPPLLEQYWHQYTESKKLLKEARHNKQTLSRKIGEAKQKGLSIDQLVVDMQATSARFKQINESLNLASNNILDIFSAEENRQKDSKPVDGEKAERYPNTDTDDLNITVSICEADTNDWNQYIAKHPAASIYHRFEWKNLIQTTFGHQSYYLAARNMGNEIVGVLPMVRLKSWLFGDYIVSMPYFNYGGAIANSAAIEQQLMQEAGTLAKQETTHHVEFRDNIERDGYPARTEKVCMILDLPEDTDSLWQQFTPKLRAQIKRPQRENPEIKTGSENLLNDFYYVFSRNMRDLGTPVYNKTFFKNILRCFPDESRIIIVSLNKRPVSAAFLIGHQKMLEIPWASTLRETNQLSMNMLLYWEVLKFAISEGYTQFDFGRSTRDAGTFRFKRQWGAEPTQLYWHYWLQENDQVPTLNPDNPKYALAIKLWKRLPLLVTTMLGPSIVKNLP
jgi:FemAB-related protein (PEP-CTERM system-associated)